MKDKLITLTTREHYNKYKNLTKGIKKEILMSLVGNLYKDIEELKKKLKEDTHLNNISMKNIDNKFYSVKGLLKRGLSLGESCCFIKHILRYIVLGAKPYFEEDIKNYQELYREWYNLSSNKKKYSKRKDLDRWFLDNKDKWILEK